MSGREAAAAVAGRRERTARGSKLIYYWRKREIKCSATAREIYGRGGGRWWRGLTCCQRSLLLRVTSLSGPSSIFSISVPRRSPPRAPGERGPWGEGGGRRRRRRRRHARDLRSRAGRRPRLVHGLAGLSRVIIRRFKGRNRGGRKQRVERARADIASLCYACETYHGDGVNWIDNCEEEHVVWLVIVFSETTIRFAPIIVRSKIQPARSAQRENEGPGLS